MTYAKNASLHKTDSLLKRLSWGSEFSYVFGTDGYGDSSFLSIDSNNGSAGCYNNRFASRPLSPWKGEYYEASTREFAQTMTSYPAASLDATFDFSFSALRDDDDEDDVAGDLFMTRCLARLDRILAQAVEVLCYEIDPDISIQVFLFYCNNYSIYFEFKLIFNMQLHEAFKARLRIDYLAIPIK